MKRSIIPLIVISIISLFIISTFYFSLIPAQSNQILILSTANLESSINPETGACIHSTGDFKGRKTPPHQGIDELVTCEPNFFYSSGRNMTRTCLTSGGCGAITNISLCNATNLTGGCRAIEGGEFDTLYGNGLSPATATVTISPTNTGNYTLNYTWTFSGTSVSVNATRLSNNSASHFAVIEWTPTTNLANTDTLSLNWSIGIT